MPSTRKSRGVEMLSYIKNLEIILGDNHLERGETEFSESVRRPDSPNYNALEGNEADSYPNPGENRSRNSANYGYNSAGTDSCAEFNRLSGELNLRISRKMAEVRGSVSAHIQRAINDAMSDQVLPQIQNALNAGSGQKTQKGRNVSAGRPEGNSEDNASQKIMSSSRSEPFPNRLIDADSTQDMVTEANEYPVMVPEFLTGRVPPRTALNHYHDDHNLLLDTTLPAQERFTPVVVQDPNNTVSDVLTNFQNSPTAQQLTIRAVNVNTMTFKGKSENFELFEDLFHTMIKMQPPEMSEQMKINHFTDF